MTFLDCITCHLASMETFGSMRPDEFAIQRYFTVVLFPPYFLVENSLFLRHAFH
jgi:hypothetical protein